MMEALLNERDWLTGRRMSQADLVAGAHISILDYFGEVSWKAWPGLKTWYMRLKSRPSFRPLLADRFQGLAPVAHYADLDFYGVGIGGVSIDAEARVAGNPIAKRCQRGQTSSDSGGALN
ncbi:hypothetical protein GGR13_002355 [Brevundimonas variabilis]|uniref:GST C-terminal domain-containing protein n=1 Tax=Brevundimonas variabilis TaxID=74312 RepID=A0A7W9CJV0_9CAUL|nr:hypothetical protein [Brevundimonas variabilis]